MLHPADQRVVKATAATLSWQGVDSDGEHADPGTVTVGVVSSDGTTVVAAGTATSGTGTSPRTYALTAAQTASCERLTATWKVGATTVATTTVDVVGGVYVSVSAARKAAPLHLADTGAHTDADVRDALRAGEQLFEDRTGVAWVPRLEVERRDGTGTTSMALAWPMLRRVAWCRIYSDATTYQTLTADQLAAIPADDAGIATRTDGYLWPAGVENVEIAYEHGEGSPPRALVDALVTYAGAMRRSHNSAIPGGAQSVSSPDGSTFAILPSETSATGIESVDRVLRQFSRKSPGIG